MSVRAVPPAVASGGALAADDAGDAVGTDPLSVVLVVVLAALVVGIWWLLRWVRRPPVVRLREALIDSEEVTVLMHPNPDPDAMGAAMGIAAIADSVGTDPVLQYPGQIRHQENRAFRTVLGLEMSRVESASELESEETVLVDHNTPRGFTGSELVEPIAVIDHHPGNGTGTRFTDVRTGYGATSTIVAEYLQDLGAMVGESEDDGEGIVVGSELATGLVYGIQSDTNHLTTGCSEAEFAASAFLFPGIDEDLLDRVANPQVSDDVLKTKAEAIIEKRVEGSFAVCDVGEIDNVDAIPQAADELMHLEGVTAVVVFGENDGTLHLSGRSRDDRVHMGESLRHAISDIPMANAGGHARMGGGQLPIEHMRGRGEDGFTKADLEDQLFSVLSGSR